MFGFKKNKGNTLVELVFVIFIITLFSTILIANFPKAQNYYALSRTAYKMAQDIRRAQDLALSGVLSGGLTVKGYGVYIDTGSSPNKYLIYADIDSSEDYDSLNDTIIETIYTDTENSNISIEDMGEVSINFAPPNPKVTITHDDIDIPEINIVLELGLDGSTRTVWVNKSGLVNVE